MTRMLPRLLEPFRFSPKGESALPSCVGAPAGARLLRAFAGTALALCLAAAMPLPARAAQTHALVVGVDQYPNDVSLDGAVRDAEDVYRAMSAAGFTVRKFTNAEARKDDIRKAWTDMVAEAVAGDTIIFTYAGHGAQMPELVAGDEADGLDEFLQLPGFDRNRYAETSNEIIVDNEMNAWFGEAESKGVHVLFVSDSCFSGGMSRSVTGKSRLAPAVTVKLAPPSQEALAGANLKEIDFKQVTVLAASLESQPTPEVIIDGEPRGALSWSFARAVEGSADRDGDGVITRIELEDYIFSNVKNRSEALQVPNFMPQVARSEGEVVVRLTRGIPVETATVAATDTSDTGGAATTPKAIKPARELGWTGSIALQIDGTADRPKNADGTGTPYRWDVAGGVFYTPNGDVAAENVGADRIQAVVDKYVLLDFLKALASQNPGSVSLTPAKDIYAAGNRLRFDAPPGRYPNMLVFNLANTGEVQFLDMQVAGTASSQFKLTDVEVVKPFGADHLITIWTAEPVDAIGAVLADKAVTSETLLKALLTRLDGKEASVAIQPLYTRETL
ncbi:MULTISPECIES: caspase family protein [unclassified Shinella]|uniref:caspase family protein n=1 Tax=unclassified Shinella TaxID=2643062 RepID=UPI00225D2C78|nr:MULTISPECIES: caspase family protein [unclassified Shinella]MCO5138328.1 caspase family protein [Shinella sp.]MDC7255165.1 caspase family protein [Shinella sp. YE25]CAI0337927.1 putative enzyme [Rhizobiaceae bacterium]CAK7256394.1 metacaspase-1 [Shinella sp. WSC3-e]